MPVTREQILEAAKVGETTDWEFKSGKGGVPGSLWSSYSAMANSEGGVIVLGVQELRDGNLRLDGLSAEEARKYRKSIWDNLHNRDHTNLNLLTESDVGEVLVDGAVLLAMRVPRAERHQRPVHLGPNPLTGTWRRNHDGDYRCAEEEVRRMLRDAADEPADHRVLDGFGLDDLDPTSLEQYRNLMRAGRANHPWLALGDREFLEMLGGWRRDRTTRKEGLTLAGLLMFGKDRAIRDPGASPQYFVDYREKLDPTTRWSDRIYPDGTWEANLLQFFRRVWPKIARALPVPFRLEGVVRQDETPAHEALREAFVNCLIHVDYRAGGGVVVEHYPDRIVFTNPGTLLVSLEQYLRGGRSECRNKALQKMLLFIGGGEQAGSGIQKIRRGWLQRWRSPLIRVQTQPEVVELTMPLVSLVEPDTIARLRERIGTPFEQLTDPEIRALAIAETEGSVSNQRLQQLLTEHRTDIGKMLQGLVERGLLHSNSRGRWTQYWLDEPKSRSGRQATLFGSPAEGRSEAGSLPPSAGRSAPAVDSPRSEVDLPRSGVDLPRSEVDLLQTEGLAALEPIARQVAERGRAKPELVRSTILTLCRGRYLTAEQLGALLRRNPDGLRDRHLTPMVRAGDLELRYPGASSRPDQAYTAKPRTAVP